ncbi:HET-domain-containing protein [Hypoxylon sp. FL0890]|nr:HET-domain-containing protein [Hypoxylon sp. FL0890]
MHYLPMDVIEPSVKALACEACWNGLFSVEGWQTVLAGKKVPGYRGYSNGYGYRTTCESLRAASDKCNWCRILARKRRHSEGGLLVFVACDQDSNCTPAGEKMITVVIHGDDGSLLSSHYYMYTDPEDKAARDIKARDRITDVSTQQGYDLALECLENCLRTHTKCPPAEPAATLLPDRVIDCSHPEKPKLVLTGGNQHGPYVALSYVWGGPQPMTTTENVNEFVNEGLEMSQFPLTIRDAVTVTHSIGQRYLWIDALCILQDSREDKNVQLGSMCRIYRDAYITINAACASSTREGFLRHHRPKKVPDARIPYRCLDGAVGSVYIASQFDTDSGDASRSYWDELEPVAWRAWCLQERLLPPRTLIYASDTLKFACQTETVNIGGALCEPSTGRRLPNSIYRSRGSSKGTHVSVSSGEEEAERVAYRQAWLAIIFMYTIRDLSVSSDKLPALGGVAEQFQIVTGDQYLAGLWRKTLLLDLIWECGYAPQPRPESYRAPSWSWASTDGLISAPYHEKEVASAGPHLRQAEILDCWVELASPHTPFGEVTGGVLKLKGGMRRVTVEESTSRSRDVLLENPDGTVVKIGILRFDSVEERPEEMYVIPLVWDVRGSFVRGIVVVRANMDQYRRIAGFDGSGSPSNVSWLENLEKEEITLI